MVIMNGSDLVMQRNRRKFFRYVLAASVTGGGSASWWLATSKDRAARYFRQAMVDVRRSIRPALVKPEPDKWADNQITLCWLGHSTVLINFYGVTLLTDPALGQRVGVSLGVGVAGPKRYIAPALTWKELPPIDVVLLSHAHMDHFDLPTLNHFQPSTFAVTAKRTSDLLKPTRLRKTTELAWDDHVRLRTAKGEIQIEAIEVKHWGRRWPSHISRGYNGYVIRREGKAILFAGDTAFTRLHLPPRSQFEAAIMPIGAYRPWIWNHCSPEQAVEMANAAGASYIVPVHHQTFRLSEEPLNEPIERLQAALEPERLALRKAGESFVCPS